MGWRSKSLVVGLGLIGPGALLGAGCSLTTSFDDLSSGGPKGPASESGAGGDASGGDSDAMVRDALGQGDVLDAVSSSTYRAAVLADAPLAYWRLGESGGAPLAKDETGNGHDGTYGGARGLGVPGAIAGDSDTAMRFDGTSAVVTIGDVFKFGGTASFTLEAWIRPSTTGGFLVVAGRSDDPDGYALYLAPGGQIGFEHQTMGADDIVQGAILPATSFSYVVATYDGASMRLYRDGALVQGPQPSGGIAGSNRSFYLGADVDGTSDHFKGDMDEVAVYDHALSDARISAHFRVGKGL